MSQVEKIVFYFPWVEVSGGPIYLVRLAEELAKDSRYSVYYVDYEDGFSNQLINSKEVKKVTVSTEDFSIPFDEPITIITPIYFACWLPKLNPESKVLFVNWHICSIPTLKHNWHTSDSNINEFLSLVHDTNSVMFCDESHRLGQNTKDIDFDKNIVPITLSTGGQKAKESLISKEEINIAILGRLCQDKIYSVLNVLDNLEPIQIERKKVVHIIGDGPDRNLIDTDSYSSIEIKFVGTLTQQALRGYLAVECDCLFAMGTSVLEGAALSLPSVVIAHNMKPMSCDSYVYIQDAPGYCLGWYDDQFDELGLNPITMRTIVDDLLKYDLKSTLGKNGYKYYSEKHTIESAVALFKEALSKTSLISRDLATKTSKFQSVLKHISVGNFDLITFNKTLPGIDVRLFGKIKLFSLRNDVDPRWKILSLSKFDLFRIGRSENFFKFSFARSKVEELKASLDSNNDILLSRLAELQNNITRLEETRSDESDLIKDKLNAIDNRLFEKLDRIHFDTVIEMDTCDKLLSQESLNYFCADIEQPYCSLVKGLDEESIEIVNRVISRIQRYVNHSTSLFPMTQHEINEHNRMVEFHSSKLLRISEDMYVYGNYKLPVDIITSTVFYHDCFMPEVHNLDKLRGKDVIDAGGSFGDSALVLSGYTDKYVHVFEPTSKMFNLATKTVEYNNLQSKVVLNKTALGDQKENLKIKVENDFSSFHFDIDSSEDANMEVVEVETLDSYVERKNLDVGVIKVDVEGFEEKLLDGAIRTIREQKPVLILSIYHSSEQFFGIKKKIECMELGYTFKIRKPLDRSIIVDTMLIAEVID